MTYFIPNRQARQLILHLQGLTHPPHKKLKSGQLLTLIEQMGFVQVDSIQWVERAHHMILFARNQTYRPQHLTRMIERDRSLFEHWTHDASIIPGKFYPNWKHRFERYRKKTQQKFLDWQGSGFLDHCDGILAKIQAEGSLRSRDIELKGARPQKMWQWHDGKAALEYLWRTGQLCIAGREGFQKIYGSPELGVLKEDFEREVSPEEFIDWACSSALHRLGFGSASDIAKFWDLVSISEVRTWLQGAGQQKAISVKVEGLTGEAHKEQIARHDIADLCENLPDIPSRLRVLSPFDPVIRDRKRLSWLFGFYYRIEIYVPEAKRQWGYYVFPLLEGDRLIGRIDMRARRKEQLLEVKRLWLEEGVKLSKARKAKIDAELARQARLANVKTVVWLKNAL